MLAHICVLKFKSIEESPWGKVHSLFGVSIFREHLALGVSQNRGPMFGGFQGKPKDHQPPGCSPSLRNTHMEVGQNQWYHVWVGAPPILVYFGWDWDVHWGYGILTHGHMSRLEHWQLLLPHTLVAHLPIKEQMLTVLPCKLTAYFQTKCRF